MKVGDFVVRKSKPSIVFRIIATSLCESEPSILMTPINDDSGWITGSHPKTLMYAEPEHLL